MAEYNSAENLSEEESVAYDSSVENQDDSSGEIKDDSEEVDDYVLPEGYVGIYETTSCNGVTTLESVEENEDGTFTATWSELMVSEVLACSEEKYEQIQVGDRLSEAVDYDYEFYDNYVCVGVGDAKYFVHDTYSSVKESEWNCDILRLKPNNRTPDGRIILTGTFYDAGDSTFDDEYSMGVIVQNAKTIIASDARIDYIKSMDSSGDQTETIAFRDFLLNNIH